MLLKIENDKQFVGFKKLKWKTPKAKMILQSEQTMDVKEQNFFNS